MKKLPLSQGKFALVDDEDFEWLNQWKWCAAKSKKFVYAVRKVKKKMLYLHRFITSAPKGKVVDHLNHDTLDNRRTNLRVCSYRENNLNLKELDAKNKSGVSGVQWLKQSKKWGAFMNSRGKTLCIGKFDSLEEAGMAVINFLPKEGP